MRANRCLISLAMFAFGCSSGGSTSSTDAGSDGGAGGKAAGGAGGKATGGAQGTGGAVDGGATQPGWALTWLIDGSLPMFSMMSTDAG